MYTKDGKWDGFWSLDRARSDYHKKNGIVPKSEDHTYTFQDGSVLTVTIESEEKTIICRDKDWHSGDPIELKDWEVTVCTKRFVIPSWTDKVFNTISAAKKWFDNDCKKSEVTV